MRRSKYPFLTWAAVLALGLVAGYFAVEAPKWAEAVRAETTEAAPAAVAESVADSEAAPGAVAEPEAELEAQPQEPTSPQELALATLERIQRENRIINVHEHIQSVNELPRLLEAKERNGIGHTVLVGSSWFTITLNPAVGFTRYDWNNDQLVEIRDLHPDKFEAWPTIDPRDPDKLTKIQDLVERGASGVKLYLGHGFTFQDEYMFHVMALDDPTMYEFYAWCEENFIPLNFHVNPGPTTPGFAQEFIAVLTDFPDLKINCPHFMLSSIRDSRLREFLLTFPNLYSDISFGHDDFLTAGLRRISRDPAKFRRIFREFPDRFLYGTDLVMTEVAFKDPDWFTERAQAYLDMLTREIYSTPVIPGVTLNGLTLEPELIENILYKNYERFRDARPKGTKITREINWSALGVEYMDREPGQAFPPQ